MQGEISASSAKNSVINLIAAALLADEPVTLLNVRLSCPEFENVVDEVISTEARKGRAAAAAVGTPKFRTSPRRIKGAAEPPLSASVDLGDY